MKHIVLRLYILKCNHVCIYKNRDKTELGITSWLFKTHIYILN